MSLDFISSALLGQTDQAAGSQWWWTLLLLVIAIPLPWFLGHRLAKYLRMPDYGWKLSLIFCTLASAAVIVSTGTLNLGVDLEGGDILVYQVDRDALGEEGEQVSSLDVDWPRLIQAISNRINPSGTKEIVVRRYGDWQIEIIVPKVDRREIKQIKKLISTAGSLEFRIVAKENNAGHARVIDAAKKQAEDPERQRSPYVRDTVRDADGNDREVIVGYWSEVGRVDPKSFKRGERGEWEKLWGRALDVCKARKKMSDSEATALANENKGPFRVQVAGDIIRNANTGALINLPPTKTKYALEQYAIEEGIHEIDVLMIVDQDLHVTGEHLGMCSRGYDETMRPMVRFSTKGQGIGLMASLTGSNLPDKQRDDYQRMAILLDGRTLSAPRIMSTISDRGQITGDFTKQEVDFLVGILHAGSLPAAVNEEPISENQIGAVLGEDTIEKGKLAIGISLGAVLVFILIWYRFAGVVACLALTVNLLLILALMMTFNAAVTLPGLAGLVLTVGMSVDANVLIFERLREELNRGAALRMVIRNGFSRATTTIVDANLTTLITALVLYAIGTDQIRGFAVTLILGILMSMFTAIFCARVVFDLFERKRRLKSLKMRRMVGETHIDFIGKRTIAAVVSCALIVVGLVAVGVRGAQIFDIDFAGGTSVTMLLNEKTDETTIRSRLKKAFDTERVEGSTVQYSVNRVDVEGEDDDTVWKIDASFKKADRLQTILANEFPVARFGMDIGDLDETTKPIPTEREKDKKTAPEEKEPAKPGKPETEDKPEAEPKDTSPAPAKVDEVAEKPQETPKPTDGAKDAPTSSKPEVTLENKAQDSEDSKPDDKGEVKPKPADQGATRTDLPPDNVLAFVGDGELMLAQAEPKKEDAPNDSNEPKPAEAKVPVEAKPATASGDEEAPEAKGGAPAADKPSEKPSAAPVNDKPKETPDDKADETEATKPDVEPTKEPPKDEAAPIVKPEPEDKPAPSKDEDTEPEGTTADSKPVEEPTSDAKDKAAATRQKVTTTSLLEFRYEINGSALKAEILEAAEAPEVDVTLTEDQVESLQPVGRPDGWRIQDPKGFEKWNVTLPVPEKKAEKIFKHMKSELDGTPYWLSSSAIGSKVAGDTRTLAIAALLTSLFGIVGYIWIRFQRVVFGLAAVVALVHDVLITLGAIAVSYWLAGVFGFLLIEEFKISLPVVAAFLTIIGYSLNDTIVVFDRIREVRGKSPELTGEMVNTSINQTLGRTLLTSLTTFLVVLILYTLGGQGIHGFAFALVIGVVVGTYSSIFVASPALLWMSQPKKTPQPKKALQ